MSEKNKKVDAEELNHSEAKVSNQEFSRLWPTKRAARYLGYSEGTFRNMRSKDEGPAYHKHKRTGECRYAKEDLDLWQDQNFIRVDPAA
jgi:hypothetical protein